MPSFDELSAGLDRGLGALRSWKHARALAALAWVVLLVWGLAKCAGGKDFLAYFDAGGAFLKLAPDFYVAGPLSGLTYYYPPFFAMVLAPFAWLLPPLVAGFLWFLLKVWLLVLVIKELALLLPKQRHLNALLFLGFLATARFVIDDLKLGQCNLFVMELSLLGMIAFKKGRANLAVLLLALATSIKIYPGIFLLYLLFSGRWAASAKMLLLLAAFNLAPALFYQGQYPALVRAFLDASVFHAGQNSESGIANQSIWAVCMRFLGRNTTDSSPLAYVNFMDLGFDQVRRVALGVELACLGALCLSLTRLRRKGGEHHLVSVTLLLCLLMPMVARKSNFVFCLFPIISALAGLRDLQGQGQPRWRFRALAACLALGVFFVGFTSDGLLTRRVSNFLECYSNLCLGALVLGGVNLALFWLRPDQLRGPRPA